MLHQLQPSPGSRRKTKRLARGDSAGGGSTAGRGTKGQQARTGKGRRFGFEGGQMPLLRRQPKMGGFRSPRKVYYEVLNLDQIDAALDAGSYDSAALRAKGLLTTKRPVKLLAMGETKKKFELTVHAASASAKAAIEKAGGKVVIEKRVS
jgi:large subunit ribosomal protein L15